MTLRLIQASLLLLLASCSPSGSSAAEPADNQAAPSANAGPPFNVAEVATFEDPWAIAFLPGSSSALVTEKPGHVWLVDVASGKKAPVAGVPAVRYKGQGGLLDVAVSPRFAADGLVYLIYSKRTPDGGSGLALARARLVRDGSARLESLQVIWQDPAGGQGGQFGGRIAFAPEGRSLFLSSGERQRFTPAQDPNQPLGKILHLTLDGKPVATGQPGAAKVTITDPPQDAVAAKSAEGQTFTWPGPNPTPAETWATGIRNPYGLAFAPDGRLWEAEAGPDGGDELNLIEKGRNYGWPVVSEGDNYDGVPIARHSSHPEFAAPKVTWTPTITPGGLLIYSGAEFPQWRGDALIPGLNGQALIRVDLDGEKAKKADRWDMGTRLRGIAQGPEGAVYLLEDGSGAKLLKLTPR